MTIGKNEYFIKEIQPNNTIIEKYDYVFYEKPITLEDEMEKARYNILSDRKKREIMLLENQGKTVKDVMIVEKLTPETILLPDNRYKPYNKAINTTVYAPMKFMIYWHNNGEVVSTFKKNGRWYLNGMGGKPFFEREAITWALRGDRILARYLPAGYILDSGSPIGVLKNGTPKDELYFLLWWLLSDKANEILKTTINHTKNIQGKDIERLPYPAWINNKVEIIEDIKRQIDMKRIDNGIIERKEERKMDIFFT